MSEIVRLEPKPRLMLKRIDTGEIVGTSAPFVPATRVVWAKWDGERWVEREELCEIESVAQFNERVLKPQILKLTRYIDEALR